MFDISIISDYLAPLQPRYVSKKALTKGIPGVSYNLRHGGSALIDRGDSEQAQQEIISLGQRAMQSGFSVVIFPEGTRSRNGRMRSFRERGLRALIENMPGVKVLPATSNGGSRLFSRNLKPLVRHVALQYRFHPPVLPPDPNDKVAFTGFVRQLEDTIRMALPPALQTPE